ncbi:MULTISPECIES: siderophore-interacting protein [unclassified Streptomyces]|uniref:siderophore-interacting protein n=1 Tax=unclassified Streptomyces TaxID=2593676 RepID=UPI002DDA61A6|nr:MULTISPECIES: siderophore-interacting protein [unclassified Streptomyces]WSA95722.1 siderophore-interacting protein [Streptomyces sp. NBC_01795]WSB80141.1 siderophore-interacting protein [Streptomyces sp. NBC_01775]WSS11651.1 siderophore-interacting protein [Streptomyces sp. NBC_01186]WSS40365.1 siderophore-interacting protein [Streptomyces sp. NBC_01187]
MSTTVSEAPPTPAAVPFEFFELRVLRTRRLGPTMQRITLGGERLGAFASGGRDQRFKLFLPQPGQDTPVVPTTAGDNWFPEWRAMDESVRAIMRSYTVRALRHGSEYGGHDELDIDFALHGDIGPASRWALGALPGDRVTLLGPVVEDNGGVDFRPPEGTDWVLLNGDETALPAIGAILEWLPAGMPVRVFAEVPRAEDIQDLPTVADARITWLVRDESAGSRAETVVEAVRAAELPPGTPYAWIAGEAGTVKALRRHLVKERAFDRRAVKFTGYWRLGATEEQLVAEALATAG